MTEPTPLQFEREQGRIEGILEQVIARLDRLDDAHRQDMTAVRQEVNAVRQEVNAVREEINAVRQEINAVRQEVNAVRQETNALGQHLDRRLDAQLRWIIGIIVGVAGLLIAAMSFMLKVLT